MPLLNHKEAIRGSRRLLTPVGECLEMGIKPQSPSASWPCPFSAVPSGLPSARSNIYASSELFPHGTQSLGLAGAFDPGLCIPRVSIGARPGPSVTRRGLESFLDSSDFRSSSAEMNREGQRMTGPVACRKSAGRSWTGRTPRGQRWPSGWPGGPGRSACGPAPDSWRPAWVSSRGPSRAPGVRV